jgi:hypothetical protein
MLAPSFVSAFGGLVSVMDWKLRAKVIFNAPKPIHFANYRHCSECSAHDQTLVASDVEDIGLDQLGHPSADPLCFSSIEGILYYMPALIRLTLDTIDSRTHSYLAQLLFHLIRDGPNNSLVNACNNMQRRYISKFLEHLIDNHASQIEIDPFSSDNILRAHEIWLIDE